MNKLNKKSIFAIIGLVLVLAISLVLPLGTAFADYSEDILNNPDAIINFNQCVLNQYINNPTTGSLINPLSDLSFNTNDKVLIRFDNQNSAEVILAFHNNATSNEQNITLHSSYYDIVTINGNYDVILSYIGTGGIIKNLNIFNLTKMFGVSNEPNLVQAKKIFVAPYYSYSKGTALTKDTFNAYISGVNSVLLGTEDVIASPLDFYNSVQSYAYNSLYSGIVNQVQGSNWINLQANTSMYNSVTHSIARLPLMKVLPYGSTVTIRCGAYGEFGSGSTDNNFFQLAYIDNEQQLQIVANSPIIGTSEVLVNENVEFSFVSPSDIKDLYIIGYRGSYWYWFKNFHVSYAVIDYEQLTETAFLNGQLSNEREVEKIQAYYAPGGLGYQSIYNQGYYAYPTDDHFTFQKLIASSIDVPVQAFTNLFDYDILGVNMKTFYLSLFTLAVIVTIIRLVL